MTRTQLRRTIIRLSIAVTLAMAAAVPLATTTATASVATSPPRPAWTYLALGDSNVYGPAEACGGCVGYPVLLAGLDPRRTHGPVTLLNASQWNHLTTSALLDEIRADDWGGSSGAEPWSRLPDAQPSPRTAIARADFITIQVGFNDLPWLAWDDPCGQTYDRNCRETVIPGLIADLDAILDEIIELRGGRPTEIRVANLFNDVIPGGYDNSAFYSPEVIAQGLGGVKKFVDRLSREMCATARQHGARCLDLYRLFNGPSHRTPVAPGVFTPEFGDINQPGQDRIAKEIERTGFAPPCRHVHGA